jgi:hypothetical protein
LNSFYLESSSLSSKSFSNLEAFLVPFFLAAPV